MSRSICFAETPFLALHMIAVASIHLLSGRCVSLKIVPVVAANWYLHFRHWYRKRSGVAFVVPSAYVLILPLRVNFETLSWSHFRQWTPSGQRVASRYIWQFSSEEKVLAVSIRFGPMRCVLPAMVQFYGWFPSLSST